MVRKNAFLLGIGGSAMSNLARYLAKLGIHVCGYDMCESSMTKALIEEGIQVVYDDSIEMIPADIISDNDSLIVYSLAITDSSMLSFFKTHGYEVLTRAQMFDRVTYGRRVVAVAGTHGKTTCTVLLSHILASAGCDIVGFCGGISKNYKSNLIVHGDIHNAIIVIEADEYKEFFLSLHPTMCVVTNIDLDHLDYYRTKDKYNRGFVKFINTLDEGKHLICDEKAYRQICNELRVYDVDLCDSLNRDVIHAENVNIDGTRFIFNYVSADKSIEKCVMTVPGKHNLSNALLVITAALRLGIPVDDICAGLTSFEGTQKRFDIKYDDGRRMIIDDYAHHPVEIKQVIDTVKLVFPFRMVTIVFRPHLYSRTKDFFYEFIKVLGRADCVIVTDIFAAREKDDGIMSAESLVRGINVDRKVMCPVNRLYDVIIKMAPHDIIVNCGAGDSENFVDVILAAMMKCDSSYPMEDQKDDISDEDTE